MPIYEYRCQECDIVFEKLHIGGDSSAACPSCGKQAKRLISPAGIIFKGSGFYITDSRKENQKSSDSESSTSSSTE